MFRNDVFVVIILILFGVETKTIKTIITRRVFFVSSTKMIIIISYEINAKSANAVVNVYKS